MGRRRGVTSSYIQSWMGDYSNTRLTEQEFRIELSSFVVSSALFFSLFCSLSFSSAPSSDPVSLLPPSPFSYNSRELDLFLPLSFLTYSSFLSLFSTFSRQDVLVCYQTILFHFTHSFILYLEEGIKSIIVTSLEGSVFERRQKRD